MTPEYINFDPSISKMFIIVKITLFKLLDKLMNVSDLPYSVKSVKLISCNN